MAERKSGSGEDPGQRRQDEFVERLRPDPAQPPQPVLTLDGLLGDSDREGYRRLYFSRALDQYAEFRSEDVVAMESVPDDAPPFVGLQSTRVTLKRDAAIEYTRAAAGPPDDFDLDVRIGAGGIESAGRIPPITLAVGTCAAVCRTIDGATCDTCRTRCDTCRTCATCQTCHTACGTCQTCDATCQGTCQNCTQTCQTQCGTCQTCHDVCDPTNVVCPTDLGCNPTFAQTHCFTCRCSTRAECF